MIITRYFRANPSAPARVQVLDRQQFIARQRRGGLEQIGAPFDPNEMLAGMEAGRTQQQREPEFLRRRQSRALQPHGPRGDHPRGCPQAAAPAPPAPVVRTRAGGLITGADDPASIASAPASARRAGSASPMAFTASACGGSASARIMEIGVDRRDGKHPVVDPGPGREVAAAGRNQQQQRHARPERRGIAV